jgi:hypothetical protein
LNAEEQSLPSFAAENEFCGAPTQATSGLISNAATKVCFIILANIFILPTLADAALPIAATRFSEPV